MIVYFAHIAAFALFFAHYCAWDDNIQTGKNETIHHVKQWLIRAGISVAAIVIISGVGEVLTLRMFGLMSVAVAFLFSAWFRYRLNKLRGKDWRYIAPWSNVYDRFFYAAACLTWWNKYHLRSHEILLRGYEKSRIVSGSDIHRAGTISYTTEVILTIAAFTVAVILGS